MRTRLFFLSVGLLALGANLPGTSGRTVTGKQFLQQSLLTCRVTGSIPGTLVTWFENDEVVAFSNASIPMEEGEVPEEDMLNASLSIQPDVWEAGDAFICQVEPKLLPFLTVQKIKDKDTGNSSVSEKTIFRPRFWKDEAETEITFTCFVSGDHPPGISIVWYENGSPLPEDDDNVQNSFEGPSFMYSNLTVYKVLQSSAGRTYACLISQKGLKTHSLPTPRKIGEKIQAKE